jgi:hypothetical protein
MASLLRTSVFTSHFTNVKFCHWVWQISDTLRDTSYLILLKREFVSNTYGVSDKNDTKPKYLFLFAQSTGIKVEIVPVTIRHFKIRKNTNYWSSTDFQQAIWYSFLTFRSILHCWIYYIKLWCKHLVSPYH